MSLISFTVLPIIGLPSPASATRIYAPSWTGKASSNAGATNPLASRLTISSPAQTMWSAFDHLGRGPAPYSGSKSFRSDILAIVLILRFDDLFSSLNTRFAKAHERRFSSSEFVHIITISASVIPALTSVLLERTDPLMTRQSIDCDSFIASRSLSIRTMSRPSCLRAAATPRPTSPAPPMIILI